MNFLVAKRVEKSWSQDTLAEASRVSKRTIQRIEKGQVVPSGEVAMQLAAALGIEAQQIIQFAGAKAVIKELFPQWDDRAATRAELERLPRRLRRPVADFHAWRRILKELTAEMKAMGEDMRAKAAEHHTAYKSIPPTPPINMPWSEAKVQIEAAEEARRGAARIWDEYVKLQEQFQDKLADWPRQQAEFIHAAYALERALWEFE